MAEEVGKEEPNGTASITGGSLRFQGLFFHARPRDRKVGSRCQMLRGRLYPFLAPVRLAPRHAATYGRQSSRDPHNLVVLDH